MRDSAVAFHGGQSMRCRTKLLEGFWLLIGALIAGSTFCYTTAAQNTATIPRRRFEGSLPALHSEGVDRMKHLSPGTGWAMVGGRLFWTIDDGTTGTEITPKATTMKIFFPFFF